MKSEENAKFLATRIIGCRTDQGLTQTELADLTGVSLRSVQVWEAGGNAPRGKSLRRLAEVFHRSVPWLLTGKDDSKYPTTPPGDAGMLHDAPPGAMALKDSFTKMVPVISWASAGLDGNFSDNEHQISERVPSDCRDPNCYALIIKGDSMEPEFRAGDRAIFMPNRTAQNGDVVVARLAKGGECLFKLYHQAGPRGDSVRLTSYNEVYPVMEFSRKEFRFIHPMYSSTRVRRH